MSKKKRNTTNHSPRVRKYGQCPVCGLHKPLTTHHILKRVVFGDNDETGDLCRDCHFRIDQLIKGFEKEILYNFERCYYQIWDSYINRQCIEDSKVQHLANMQILRGRMKSSRRRGKYGQGVPKTGNQVNDKKSLVVTRRTRKKKHLALSDEQFKAYQNGICPICGEKTKLTIHHIPKRMIFGENGSLGFPCRECHDEVELSVSLLEAHILRKFEPCYKELWRLYLKNGNIPESKIRALARRQFSKIKHDLMGLDQRHEMLFYRQSYLEKQDVYAYNPGKTKVFI